MLLSQQLGLFIVLVTGVLLRCAALAIAHNHVLWNCHLSSRLLSLLTHVTLVVITYICLTWRLAGLLMVLLVPPVS